MSKRDKYSERDTTLPPVDNHALDSSLFGAIQKRGISLAQSGQIQVGGYTLTALGLQGEGSKADWEQVGGLLFDLEGKVQLLIGDWLNIAQIKYGETYKEIAAETGKKAQSLYNYKWVAEKVPFSIRVETLSYSHYYLLAGVDDPDRKIELIRRAAAEGWTVSRLRAEVYPPTLPSRTRPDSFNFRDKKRQIDKMWKVLQKARDDEKARHEALGRVVEVEQWIAEMKAWLQED